MNKSLQKIACIGEVMIELSMIGEDTGKIGVAGDSFNTAVYLNRLLDDPGCVVSYVTALGDDPMSDRIMTALADEGIDRSLVECRNGMTPGLYAISVDDTGERSFSYWRSAAAARTLFAAPCQVNMAQLEPFDLVYLSGISLAILPQQVRTALYAWIDTYRAAGGKVAFDSNYRPKLWEDAQTAQRETMQMWRRADVALPSVDDEMALFCDADDSAVIARIAPDGPVFGALKRGPDGPRPLDNRVPALQVTPVANVVDTTAAGDSFNAGFLAAYCRGADISACMQAGHDLSSQVIQHRGAIIPH